MDKIPVKVKEKGSRFDINEIERSIQQTITALEKFVYDKGVSRKGKIKHNKD